MQLFVETHYKWLLRLLNKDKGVRMSTLATHSMQADPPIHHNSRCVAMPALTHTQGDGTAWHVQPTVQHDTEGLWKKVRTAPLLYA
jgi:hypothetical protein